MTLYKEDCSAVTFLISDGTAYKGKVLEGQKALYYGVTAEIKAEWGPTKTRRDNMF